MRNDPVDGHSETARLVAAPHNALELKVAALKGMENAELRAVWHKTWGRDAPKGARKRFLMLGIAWKSQAELYGGFDHELARRMSALETRGPIGAVDPSKKIGDVSMALRPAPGTRLVREWRGDRHEVHVIEGGYLWRGKTFGSLSGVARAITGVSRNGPKFFGLRENRKAS